MAVEILLPQTTPTAQRDRVTRWFAHDGDPVREGEPLFALESGTDTIAAPASGVLKINASCDASYEVGTVLGYID